MPGDIHKIPNPATGFIVAVSTARGGYVDLQTLSDLGQANPVAWTFETWINPLENSANGVIASLADGGTEMFRLELVNGQVQATNLPLSKFTLTNNDWTHIAVSYEGSSCSLIIDGILDQQGSGPAIDLANKSVAAQLGRSTDGSSPLKAYFQECRIWNRSLDQLEVKFGLYYKPVEGMELEAYYDFSQRADVSSHKRPLSLQGAAEYVNTFCACDLNSNGSVHIKDCQTLSWEETKPFVVEAWICPETNCQGIIFSKCSSDHSHLVLLYMESGVPNFQIQHGTKQFSVKSDRILDSGTWYHVCARFKGDQIDILVDGDPASTPVGAQFVESEEPECMVMIGKNDHVPQPITALIQEVRLWNAYRTDAEIKDVMRKYPLNNKNLIGYWTFGLYDSVDLVANHIPEFQGSAAFVTVAVAADTQALPLSFGKRDLFVCSPPTFVFWIVAAIVVAIVCVVEAVVIIAEEVYLSSIDFGGDEMLSYGDCIGNCKYVKDASDAWIKDPSNIQKLIDFISAVNHCQGDAGMGLISGGGHNNTQTSTGQLTGKKRKRLDEFIDLPDEAQAPALKRINTVASAIEVEEEVDLWELKTFQASKGDCLLLNAFTIEADGDNKRNSILIDGGFKSNYTANVMSFPTSLDMVCGTHIDNDHLCGLIGLLKQLKESPLPPLTVESLWFNSVPAGGLETDNQTDDCDEEEPDDAINSDASDEVFATELEKPILQGVRSARKISELANRAPVTPISGITKGSQKDDIGTIKFKVFGPIQTNLDRLNQTIAGGTRPTSEIANRASIMFKVFSGCEKNKSEILFTADGWDRSNTNPVKQDIRTNGYGPASAHFDFMKVPHHGSNHSEDEAFYINYTAQYYIISGRDSASGDNPNYETLEWIVRNNHNAGRMDYSIYVTNECNGTTQLRRSQYNPVDCQYNLFALKPAVNNFAFWIINGIISVPVEGPVGSVTRLGKL